MEMANKSILEKTAIIKKSVFDLGITNKKHNKSKKSGWNFLYEFHYNYA